MKSLYAFGGLVALCVVVWMAGAQPPGISQPNPLAPPPATREPLPFVRSGDPQPPDLNARSIEQLIVYITDLKKQQAELAAQEAKAVTVLKEKLKQANLKAAEFGGYLSEGKKSAVEIF